MWSETELDRRQGRAKIRITDLDPLDLPFAIDHLKAKLEQLYSAPMPASETPGFWMPFRCSAAQGKAESPSSPGCREIMVVTLLGLGIAAGGHDENDWMNTLGIQRDHGEMNPRIRVLRDEDHKSISIDIEGL
jgi:hypothetical protein